MTDYDTSTSQNIQYPHWQRELEAALLSHDKPPRRALAPQQRDTRNRPGNGSDIEGRFPFAITRARLGQVLRGWASVNAVADLAAGSTTVSISPEGRTPSAGRALP